MPLWLQIFMFTRNMYPLRHLNSQHPTPSSEWDVANIPFSGPPYLLTDRPHGTRRPWGRFLPRGNTLGRLSSAQDPLHRPHMLTHDYPRQRPTRRSRAQGTAPHPTARARVHKQSMGSRRPASWLSLEPTRMPRPLPLLAASACRARAQLKLQPAKPLHSIDSAGRIDTARRATACALRCSFSAARCGRGHLDRVNERLHSSSTIGSRRRIFLWAGMRLQTSGLMLADGKVDKSRGRAQEGGEAKQRPSLQHWAAVPMSGSNKVQGSADVYRV